MFAILLFLSKRYFAGEFSLKRWAPVVLTGHLLLNPRIMEYDVAPIALTMALVLVAVCGAGKFAGLDRGAGGGAVCGDERGRGLYAAGLGGSPVVEAYGGAGACQGVFGVGAWDLFTVRRTRGNEAEGTGIYEEVLIAARGMRMDDPII